MSDLVQLARLAMITKGEKDDEGCYSYEDGVVSITGDAFATPTYIGFRLAHGYTIVYIFGGGYKNSEHRPAATAHLERVLVLEELSVDGMAEGLDAVEDEPTGTDHPPAAR